MRLHTPFPCGSLSLAGTLDSAPATTGLLIVSGGNEIRSGAFMGQSNLAASIAKAGFPVFRFDRRGIGDSEGENRGFRKSAKDIRAALDAFKAISPQMERVFAFGNCDAASALMLSQGGGCDGLILANPWTIEQGEGSTPLPAAIRSRYANKLRSPSEIKRLLTGGVNLRKLLGGMFRSVGGEPSASGLAEEMREGLSGFEGPVRILLATADRTAQTFEANWDKADPRIHRCDGAGHAFVEPSHRDWLEQQILAALRA